MNFQFPYHPVRVFVVPIEETSEIIRHFRVGRAFDDSDEMSASVTDRVLGISKVVPLTIKGAWESELSLAFIRTITTQEARRIQNLFPLEEEGVMRMGMESYLSDWSSEAGPDYLAEAFLREQGVTLWWD